MAYNLDKVIDTNENKTNLQKEEEKQPLVVEDSSGIKEILLIISLVASMTLIAVATSVITPFYPKEADKRGASSSQYGFVFGALELVAFSAGVPVGRMADRLSPRWVFLSGLLTQVAALATFGVLQLVTDLFTFLTLSCLSRVLSGLAKAIINVSMFSFTPLLFPKKAASLTSLGEAMYGVGLLIGPVIGGFLYDFQGFYFPFLFITLLHLPIILMTWLYMPSKAMPKKDETTDNILWRIVSVFDVWICLFSCAVGSAGTAMDLLSMEPKMRFLDDSASIVGLVFSIGPVTYISANIIIGKVCDKGVSPIYIMLGGNLIAATGTALFGYTQDIYQIVLSCFLKALGMAGGFVPSLLYMTEVCLKRGFEDNSSIRGAVSGIFVASSSLGAIFGYFVGGLSSAAIGVTDSYYIVTGIFASAGLGVLISMINSVCRTEPQQKK